MMTDFVEYPLDVLLLSPGLMRFTGLYVLGWPWHHGTHHVVILPPIDFHIRVLDPHPARYRTAHPADFHRGDLPGLHLHSLRRTSRAAPVRWDHAVEAVFAGRHKTEGEPAL